METKMAKHNKKRNVGIVYELLLKYVSSKLVENKKSEAQVALDIIEKRFNKNTELFKEFRLFKALTTSTAEDSAIAAAIIQESKQAAKRIDETKLNSEKSKLIHDINYKINDDSFFSASINEYKLFATIQTLINDWRKGDRSDLTRMVMYEGQLIQQLLATKEIAPVLEEQKTEDTDKLVIKIMTEKLNEKYSDSLTTEQKDIIKNYVFAAADGDMGKFTTYLEEIKTNTLSMVTELHRTTDNDIILEKVEEVKNKITSLNTDDIQDSTIQRFLQVSSLKDELMRAQ
jgi:hypothetical protein